MTLLRLHPLPAFLLLLLLYMIGIVLASAPLEMEFSWLLRAAAALVILAYPAFVAWQLDRRFGVEVKLNRVRLGLALAIFALFYGPGLPFLLRSGSQDLWLGIPQNAVAIVGVAAYLYVNSLASESLTRAEGGPPLAQGLHILRAHLSLFSFLALPIGIILIQKRLRRLLGHLA